MQSPSRIQIKRNAHKIIEVTRGGTLIATIADHRHTSRICAPSVRDNWAVLWTSGRVDWHGSYSEARDNALKGN